MWCSFGYIKYFIMWNWTEKFFMVVKHRQPSKYVYSLKNAYKVCLTLPSSDLLYSSLYMQIPIQRRNIWICTYNELHNKSHDGEVWRWQGLLGWVKSFSVGTDWEIFVCVYAWSIQRSYNLVMQDPTLTSLAP
jgi:hypothetical protein